MEQLARNRVEARRAGTMITVDVMGFLVASRH